MLVIGKQRRRPKSYKGGRAKYEGYEGGCTRWIRSREMRPWLGGAVGDVPSAIPPPSNLQLPELAGLSAGGLSCGSRLGGATTLTLPPTVLGGTTEYDVREKSE